ncbi:MAG: hypothetical protein R3E79_04105 [Caldilineaceae bacterium]
MAEKYLDKSTPAMTLSKLARQNILNPFDRIGCKGRVAGLAWIGQRTAMRAIVGLVDDPYGTRRVRWWLM